LGLEALVEACEDTRDMFGWDEEEGIVEEINDAWLFGLKDDNDDDDDDDDNKKKMTKKRKYVGDVNLTPFSRFSFKTTTLLAPKDYTVMKCISFNFNIITLIGVCCCCCCCCDMLLIWMRFYI
jgi:hypothetical protein